MPTRSTLSRSTPGLVYEACNSSICTVILYCARYLLPLQKRYVYLITRFIDLDSDTELYINNAGWSIYAIYIDGRHIETISQIFVQQAFVENDGLVVSVMQLARPLTCIQRVFSSDDFWWLTPSPLERSSHSSSQLERARNGLPLCAFLAIVIKESTRSPLYTLFTAYLFSWFLYLYFSPLLVFTSIHLPEDATRLGPMTPVSYLE